MATQLGVNEWTVGNWETGQTNPVLRFVPAIIRFLGYDPEPPQQKTIAEHLKAKRRELGWSQKDAARHLGVDPSTWSSWERGGTIMALAHRKCVATFIDMPESEIRSLMRMRWGTVHRTPLHKQP